MAKHTSIRDVVEEIYQSVMATPKRQRKLRSKTFWEKFGFGRRNKDRVDLVRETIKQRGLLLNLPNAEDSSFGSKAKDEWIVLSFINSPVDISTSSGTQAAGPGISVVTPPTDWFEVMQSREFESEREVEYYFIVPLLEALGYTESDFAIGYRVQMYEGVKKVNKEADFVIFNGTSRSKDDALLVIEAKRMGNFLTEDAVGQARAYALWLTTPYYLATNGEDIRVYLFRGAVQPDVMLMHFGRKELADNWASFYQKLNRTSVIEHKAKLLKVFQSASA